MMKTAAFLLTAACLAAFPALAQTGKPIASGPRSTQFKIDPTALKSIKLAPSATAVDELDAAFANVKSEADAVHVARRSFDNAEMTCASRTYSSQDMRDAGCADTDTVAACTEKLYRRCTQPAVSEYQRRALAFQRSVKVLDLKAQSLAFLH
jgi:hypothetical protein